MTRADYYCVIGNPVEHSLSPLIHGWFAEQTGQRLRYDRKRFEIGGFAAALERERAAGLCGANVTVPFKQDAYDYAAARSERARLAGAVNTLRFDSNGCYGDNTDGVGLLNDLQNHGVALRGRTVLLLGAGGAARGVLAPLLAAQPGRVVIANRSRPKALALAARFAARERRHGISVGPYGCGLDEIPDGPFDVVINATAAGLSGEAPPLPDGCLDDGGVAYDMVYVTPTPFMRWAAARGATVLDGLGMLVEQAAESFTLWRGVRPDTAGIIARLRAR